MLTVRWGFCVCFVVGTIWLGEGRYISHVMSLINRLNKVLNWESQSMIHLMFSQMHSQCLTVEMPNSI